MAKPLKDILAGVKKSKVVPGSTGKDPGVDYAPKAKAEQDFVAQHEVEKHEDRVGNGDDVYKGTTKYSLEKEDKHGHKKPKDTKVYDKVAEEASCNMTAEGTHCPVHEEAACPSTGKKIQENAIKAEYNQLKKHDIKTLRDMVGRQSRVTDTKELKSKDHAISAYLRNKHGDKKVDAAFNESLAVPLVGSAGDGDESAEMAKAELKAIANKALHLVMQIPDSMVLEAWVQSKIAKAKEHISSVHDYMVYGDHEEQTAPYEGGIDMSSGTVRNTLPNFAADVNTGRNV